MITIAKQCIAAEAVTATLSSAAELSHWAAGGGNMKRVIGYLSGFLGFLMQGGAVIGLPVYVIFFGGSGWWLLAFMPLGLAGMISLSIGSRLISESDAESG